MSAVIVEMARATILEMIAEDRMSEPDWDAYGADPVTPAHVDAALGFVAALPADVELPDWGAEPDGCITMWWGKSKDWCLSVSVEATGGLPYAALFDGQSVSGVGAVTADGISARVLGLIRGASGRAMIVP